jgi:hypothetical protein
MEAAVVNPPSLRFRARDYGAPAPTLPELQPQARPEFQSPGPSGLYPLDALKEVVIVSKKRTRPQSKMPGY